MSFLNISIIWGIIATVSMLITSYFLIAARKELALTREMHGEGKNLFESAFHKNHLVILLICPETGMIIEANAAACEYYRYSRTELLSMHIEEINMSPSEVIFEEMEKVGKDKKRMFFFRHKLSNGEIRDVEVYSGIIVAHGRTMLYSIVHDITDRKRAEDRIIKMAYYDALTGFPNKTLFNDYLSQAVHNAKKKGHMLGVLLMDFDRFKNINNILNHNVGDKFIKAASERIKSLLDDDCYIAKIGGDEFAVLIPELHSGDRALKVAEAIVNEFKTPTRVDNYELFSTISVGISILPSHGTSRETLIKNANIAMYRAKELGRDNFKVFTKGMKEDVLDEFNLANSLGGVVERNELILHYQPKVDMNSGEISGVEALVRWNHPELGFISPSDFIPISEETGLIVPIGEWVLRTACLQSKRWKEEGMPEIKMAVNISGRQLQSHGFLRVVSDILKETEMDPHLLEFEITESIAIGNIPRTNKIINELKHLGINIAMDDFGTGYSALSYLNQINLDILKIDQSFIRALTGTPKGKEITEAIITMAHALELKVTAEGVETDEHMEFLKTQRCDYIQGYYISRPVEGDAIRGMLIKQSCLTK